MPNNELKPCPFCGASAFICCYPVWRTNRFREMYEVGCSKACCLVRVYKTEKQAIDAWNRRTGEHSNGNN